MYYLLVRQFARTLKQLDGILAKSERYAESRKFDINNLIGARLAPDMLPFVAQIRIACDSAKTSAALLSGRDAPKHDDNEKTFEELHARIGKVLTFIDTLTESDFSKTTPDTKIKLPNRDQTLRANDFVILRQIPNFHFHVVTAYNILRQAGVDVGKTDYLGDLPWTSN
jgi:uncharacterized protein